MRYVIAGVDEGGKSCATTDAAARFAEVAPGLAAAGVFATSHSPPPARPPGAGELVDLGVEPGLCNWVLWRFEPGSEYPMHHTDTVDFDVIIKGSVDLVLDDGPHRLQRGDCAVVLGVDHSWRAGDEGCVISGIALGSAREP